MSPKKITVKTIEALLDALKENPDLPTACLKLGLRPSVVEAEIQRNEDFAFDVRQAQSALQGKLIEQLKSVALDPDHRDTVRATGELFKLTHIKTIDAAKQPAQIYDFRKLTTEQMVLVKDAVMLLGYIKVTEDSPLYNEVVAYQALTTGHDRDEHRQTVRDVQPDGNAPRLWTPGFTTEPGVIKDSAS